MRCTKRPIVETKATENPVRPCVLCCFELCADAGSVSGLKESKSASTWPNMVCSRPRLDWSPLREATEEPSSSELLETHFLLLVVRLLILSKKHIQRKINHTLLFVFWYEYFILGKRDLPDVTWVAERELRVQNLRNHDRWFVLCFLWLALSGSYTLNSHCGI